MEVSVCVCVCGLRDHDQEVITCVPDVGENNIPGGNKVSGWSVVE